MQSVADDLVMSLMVDIQGLLSATVVSEINDSRRSLVTIIASVQLF